MYANRSGLLRFISPPPVLKRAFPMTLPDRGADGHVRVSGQTGSRGRSRPRPGLHRFMAGEQARKERGTPLEPWLLERFLPRRERTPQGGGGPSFTSCALFAGDAIRPQDLPVESRRHEVTPFSRDRVSRGPRLHRRFVFVWKIPPECFGDCHGWKPSSSTQHARQAPGCFQ
jgi:hypothetical protein